MTAINVVGYKCFPHNRHSGRKMERAEEVNKKAFSFEIREKQQKLVVGIQKKKNESAIIKKVMELY